MVGLGAGGIDFSSHFLGYETQFLARIRVGFDDFHEIFAMLAQADLFFVDVQFLKIENHFLFQPFRIRGNGKLGQSGIYLFLDCRNPFSLQCFDFRNEIHDVGHLCRHVGKQGFPLLLPVCAQVVHCPAYTSEDFRPVFIVYYVLLFPAVHHVGESQDCGKDVPGVYIPFSGKFIVYQRIYIVYLSIVGQCRFRVYFLGVLGGIRFESHEEVYVAPVQFLSDILAHIQFPVFRKKGRLDADVGVFPVEGFDFDGDFAARDIGLGFSVAGHG